MTIETMQKYMNNSVLLALCWGVGGSLGLQDRIDFSTKVAQMCQSAGCVQSTSFGGLSPIDHQVRMDDGNFYPWN
jgi:hypothetical protein